MSEELVGQMVINFYEKGEPVIEFDGIVDPGNLTTLRYHIRTQYDMKYMIPRRDSEIKNELERAEQIKAQRALKEKERLELLELKKRTADAILNEERERVREKKALVKLENQKIEAERLIRKYEESQVDVSVVDEARETLVQVTKELEALKSEQAANKKEDSNDGSEEGREEGQEGTDNGGSSSDPEQPITTGSDQGESDSSGDDDPADDSDTGEEVQSEDAEAGGTE